MDVLGNHGQNVWFMNLLFSDSTQPSDTVCRPITNRPRAVNVTFVKSSILVGVVPYQNLAHYPG